MPGPSSYDYAYVRVVPRVERGEFINAGVILFCRTQDFLQARVWLNRDRLRALDPGLDPDFTEEYLALIPKICAGAGPIGRLSLADRFHWLVAPRSTVIQPSPVHCGLCTEPERVLDQLMGEFVR